MKRMNVIIIYNQERDKILMCLRSKEPYKGLFNLVGGKLEPGELGINGAYRELEEETGITKKDVQLKHLMDFKYYMSNIALEVYVGHLTKEIDLIEEVNKLYWVDTTDNFFDINKYAGEGNIGHMIEQVKIYQKKLLK